MKDSSGTQDDKTPPNNIVRTIEWHMMDKAKFFPLLMISSFAQLSTLYPLILINTRLQIQKHNNLYTGIFDAYRKIYKHEGVRGLYRGFCIYSVQIVSGVCYLYTYEGVRHLLSQNNVTANTKALIAGGAASLVGESVIVPLDVLSQHLMMIGIDAKGGQKNVYSALGMQYDPSERKFNITLQVIKQIYHIDGLTGFYRGYCATLASYVPNSALWWGSYQIYQDQLYSTLPVWVSHLFIQCVSGTLGGFTSTILTNPMDVVRARLQVQRLGSARQAFRDLWTEEGLHMFYKGLRVRLIRSVIASFTVIFGYETIKRLSLKDEYKDIVKW